MPSTFKLSTLLQNSYAASATRAPIRHSVPEINASLTNAWSVAAEFTGTGANVILVDTGLVIKVNTVTQLDPITRATIVPTQVKGFIISVAGPTGGAAVTVASAGFCKLTTSAAMNLPIGRVFALHLPTTTNATASESLTIAIPAAGYTVSVVAYGSGPA